MSTLGDPASETPYGAEIITVRAPASTLSKQAIPVFEGIADSTAGTRGLSMYKVRIPPGGVSETHVHKDHETAIYLLSGTVETVYGPTLEKSVVNRPGDFVFIPPDLPHRARNLSDTEAAEAIVARNDASLQQNVALYDPDGHR